MNSTSLDILGLHIGEPTTTLTNVLISSLSFTLLYKLARPTKEFKINSYWRMFFLFFGISSFLGIFKHGFKSYFTEDSFTYVMLLVHLTSVPIAHYNLKINIELSSFSDKNKKLGNIIVLLFSLVIATLTIIFNHFAVVKTMAAISILVTIINHARLYKNGSEAAGKIVKGFGVSIASVVVHTSKFSFGDWFNYIDIAHVFMMVSLIYLYQGVKLYSFEKLESKV